MDRRDVPSQSPVNTHSFFDGSPGHPNPVLRSPALSHERPYGMHTLPSAFSMMGRRPGLSHPSADFLSQDPILGSQASLSPPGPLHSGLSVSAGGPGWPWMSAHPHITSPDYFSGHISSSWLGGHEHEHGRDDCLFPTPRPHGGLMNGVNSAGGFSAGSGIFYPHPSSPTPPLHSSAHHTSPVTAFKNWSNHSNHNPRSSYDHSDNHDVELFSAQVKARHSSLSLSDDSTVDRDLGVKALEMPSFVQERAEHRTEQQSDKHMERVTMESTGVLPGARYPSKEPSIPAPKPSGVKHTTRTTPSTKQSKADAKKSEQMQRNLKPEEAKISTATNAPQMLPEESPVHPPSQIVSQETKSLPPPPKLTKTKALPPPRLQVPKSILNEREGIIPKNTNAPENLLPARETLPTVDRPQAVAHRPSLLNSSRPAKSSTPPKVVKKTPERPSVLKQVSKKSASVPAAATSVDKLSAQIITSKATSTTVSHTSTSSKPTLPKPPKVPSGKPLAIARFRVPYNNEDTSDEESDSSEVSSESESGSGSDDESEEEAEGEGEGEGEGESSGSDSSSESDGSEEEEEEGAEEDDEDDDEEEKSAIVTNQLESGGTDGPSQKRKLSMDATGGPRKRRRSIDEEAIKIPIGQGWRRQTRLRPVGAHGGSRGDVYYFAPCGKKLRTYPEVARYLAKNNIALLSVENFSFSTKLHIGQFLECKQGSTFELLSEEEVQRRQAADEVKKSIREKVSKKKERRKQQTELVKKAQLRKKLEKQMAVEAAKRAKKERVEDRKVKKLERLQAIQEARQAKREQVRMHVEQRKLVKERAKQQRRMDKTQKQEQTRLEKEMRAQQAQEAHHRKKEDVANTKYEEAMNKAKDRELKRQQGVLLKQQEREQKRQQQMMIRALESQRKTEERERQKEEKRMEKKLIKERKLEQKRRELILARELKKPVEDMVLRDAKSLPALPWLTNCVIPGQAFADLLMVEEFVQNFGEALDIDTSTELPSVRDMQLSMLCEGEDVLLPLCQQLLMQALIDPGCDGPFSVTALGQPLHKVELNDNNTSEILRLVILSRSGGVHELAEALTEKPFQSLSPVVKGSVMAFLCNELLCSKVVCREIENSIEHMSNLRRDKWVVEGKIRKLKAIQTEKYPVVKVKKPPGRPRADVASVETENSRDASVAEDSMQGNDDEDEDEDEEEEEEEEEDDDDDSGEGGGNGSDSSEESDDDDDDTEPQTQEELERRLKKLEKKHAQFRSKLFSNSHSLRALSLGQDRYKRRFWVLPHTGGVFIEGMASAEKEGLLDVNKDGEEVQGDRERVEKMDINIAIKEGGRRKRTTLHISGSQNLKNSELKSPKMERGVVSPVNGTNQAISSASEMEVGKLNCSLSPGTTAPSQFVKIENLIKNNTGISSQMLLSPSQNLIVSQVANTSNNWFSLLPRMPCDESSLTLSHTPLSGNFVPTYSMKAEVDLVDSPVPIKRPPGRPPRNAAEVVFQPNMVSVLGSGTPLATLKGQCLLASPASQTSSLSSTPEKTVATSASSTAHVSTMSLSFEELKKSVLESLRREPAPIPPELQHGWWRITEPSQIKELTKVLHCRGIREKMLQKNFHKYSDYISTSCKKNFDDDDDDSDSDSDDDESDDKKMGRKEAGHVVEDTEFPATEFAVNKSLLKEVEELEEKVFAASLQVKGWKLPVKVSKGLIFNPDAKANADNGPMSIAAARLAAVELGIERRYLKHPFRDDKVQIPTNIGTALAPGEVPSGEGNQQNPDENAPGSKSSANVTSALKTWRTAVSTANNASQLAMCLSMLVSCIAWEKSIMKVFCQMCRKGDNEELLLLCDGCDRGYHTYCCTPKLLTIPEGDWYCMDCIVLAAGGDNCCVCGGATGKMAKCDNCPRNFHLQCLEPPLVKLPRSSWTCPNCKKRRGKNRAGGRKKEKKKQEQEAEAELELELELELEEEKDEIDDGQEIRHHVNRKQTSKDMAPCRVVLAEMEKHEDAWPFLVPVNAKQFPEYYKIIRKPMDFHTMKIKLRDYQYTSRQEFVDDSRLVFSNCEEFNEDDSEVGQAGKRLSKFFECRWSDLMALDSS